MTKEVKAALIGGICTIIGGFIGIFSVNISTEKEISNLLENYKELQSENTELKEINNDLQNQLNSVTNENQSLKSSQRSLTSDNKAGDEESSDYEISNNKVSIFDLTPFQGEMYWVKDVTFPFVDETDWLIDMYGNEFHSGYLAYHYEEKHEVEAVYLLNNEYTTCNIMMAWPRGGKDLVDASAFIKFYSDGELFYISPEIKCGDEPIEFSFSVENVKKLSFECISVGNNNAWVAVTIIYPYFDFVK